MNNNNGFSDALKQLKTVAAVNERTTIETRKKAAEYFVEQLRPLLRRSASNKKHMADDLQVIVSGDVVQVIFGEDGWYWFLVEHGHKKRSGRGRVPGTHTIKNTTDREGQKLAEMMRDDILNKLGG